MSRSSLATASALAMDDLLAGEREFAFSDEDFRSLAEIAHRKVGIVLSDSKRNLVYSRLSRRLRQLELSTFREYRDYLAASEPEIESFINAISTNLTKFFREPHHFDHFRTHVAAAFARGPARRLRVWSAGCSTGEEPYTIAMVLTREQRDIGRRDARILATDIDTEVLSRAARGIYPVDALAEVPKPYLEFSDRDPNDAGSIIMKDELRPLISFGRLNLLESWPMRGPFDAIFCRNVMIYFDAATKSALVDRFIAMLAPGGWLYIGHSESLLGSHPGLKLVGRTIYRRET